MYRFLRITAEKTFGIFDGTATIHRYIRMDAPNIFKPMTKTAYLDLPDPHINAPMLRIPTQVTVGGKLSCCVYVEDALLLLGLAGIRIDSGLTVPWTTLSSLQGDLASATFDFGWALQDGTLKRKRYLGVKAPKARIHAAEGNDPRVMVELDLIGAVPQGNTFDSSADPDATALPEPTAANYSTNPYLIYHAAATVGGTSRPHLKGFEVNIENMMKGYFENKRFAQRITCRGRKVTWKPTLLLDATTAPDRATYESQVATGGTGEIVLTDGANSVTMNFQTQNFINTFDEDMPLDEDSYATEEISALVDTGVDFALTVV